ncbi:ThuA domain-containing protein [Sediminibacillus massiliensis]|uniref:ThuA domain-containing protein n=1 Tax=Sediminibacillus massiliensis TaxID=1926277 RepID=UPI0009888689|nr:ThuA domain-containing protein [Sediminibacillus massiliensis]
MAKKITAVLGDYYHERETAVQSLNEAVRLLNADSGMEVEVDYLTVEELAENIKTQPSAVVLFAENRINPNDENVRTWMNEETAGIINNYVEAGGGWLAWHAGLASYESVVPYVAMLRGYFKYHPEKHQVVKYATVPKNNLIEERETFEFLDEHYFVHCEEENTNVFLKSDSVDGSSIAGWFHDYGKGRVVCLTPAHLEEGLLNKDFLHMLVRSLEWSCQAGS